VRPENRHQKTQDQDGYALKMFVHVVPSGSRQKHLARNRAHGNGQGSFILQASEPITIKKANSQQQPVPHTTCPRQVGGAKT